MIQPDWSKQNYIPEGLTTENVKRTDLKTDDKVLVLGEVFIVLKNGWDKDQDCYVLEMKHQTDPEAMVRECYIYIGEPSKVLRRITS